MKPPSHLPFDATFRKTFRDLVLWRRDVRRLGGPFRSRDLRLQRVAADSRRRIKTIIGIG